MGHDNEDKQLVVGRGVIYRKELEGVCIEEGSHSEISGKLS